MALVVKNLETDFKKVFKKMKDAGKNSSDSDFSEGIASACKSYIEAGEITTVDGGTVSSGVFAGGGTGSISLDDSLMSEVLDTATQEMKSMTSGGDNTLATALFSGLNAMISAGSVEIDVTGATTSPSGSTVPPSSGTSKGTGLNCTDSGFVKSVKGIFQDMINKRNDEGFNGDEYLAEHLAGTINTYISTGTVTTSGEGDLSGVTGAGSIA